MNNSNNLQQIYNDIATEFSASRVFPWEELQVFIPYLRENFKVLDLGCGNGRLLKLLSALPMDYDYLGVDFASELIAQAHQYFPDHKFILADMTQLNLAPESYDMICLIASFHHLDSKELRQKMLADAYRWLKPGGYLFMTNWNLVQKKYWRYFLQNFSHKHAWNDCFIPWQKYSDDNQKLWRYYHSFTNRELTNLVKEAGFSLEPKGVYKTKWNINTLVQKI